MNKRKTAALVAALSISASIALSGTLAWRSISQEAKNEIVRTLNPGARLHDDFDGRNKDVYVENFSTLAEGGVPIFARVRLDEYMEVGPDSGTNLTDPDRQATSLVPGADINNVATWRTHLPGDDPQKGDSTDPFHTHWTWELGGSTIYMPTFNKNKDSLKADINGTWANRFNDYHAYELDETVPDGDTCYDDDENDEEDDGIRWEKETHTAQETPTATVLTMAAWQAQGCPLGPYWVYDTDGWAYWAQALAPGEATGLLLDSIEPQTDGPNYYGVNVVGQFVTAGEWGSEDGKDGFYAPDAGAPPTDEALLLLKLAAGLEYTVDLAPQTPEGEPPAEGDPLTVVQGETLQFQATVACAGTEISTQTVTWTLSGAVQAGTSISETGLLTVSAEELPNTVLTVTAQAWTGAESSLEVTVTAPEPDPEPDPDPDPAPGADSETKTAPEAPSDPDPEPETMPDPEPGSEAAPEPASKPDLEPGLLLPPDA